MAVITKISAHPIQDSRGDETIEVSLECGEIAVKASVPRGKSSGTHEAKSLGVAEAIRNIEEIIAPALVGKDVEDQAKIDSLLLELDGTADKGKLGGNSILAVSIACARVAAKAKQMPLWKHLRELGGFQVEDVREGIIYPRLYMNLINGGLHAGNNLEFQEYILIPKTKSFSESYDIGKKVLNSLGELLAQKGELKIGDEGGFAPDFVDNAEPFTYLSEAVKAENLEDKVDFGMDAAASGIDWPEEKLVAFYKDITQRFPLVYLEDPYGEEKFGEFKKLKDELGTVAIAGDDLTVTNMERMEQANNSGSINAIIIKPNQIGTVSETLNAVNLAKQYGWKVVVSHRSGETDDVFISDLAVGVGADGFKLGAPSRPERIAKFERLLEIEKELGII